LVRPALAARSVDRADITICAHLCPIDCPETPPLQDSWSHDPRVAGSNPAPAMSLTRDRAVLGFRFNPAPLYEKASQIVGFGRPRADRKLCVCFSCRYALK